MDGQQRFILNLLRGGNLIRLVDGRYTDGFVDTDALKALIDAGLVTVTEIKGMRFVKAQEPQP